MHRNILGLLAAVALVSFPQIALADGDHMRNDHMRNNDAGGGGSGRRSYRRCDRGRSRGSCSRRPGWMTAVQFDNVDDEATIAAHSSTTQTTNCPN